MIDFSKFKENLSVDAFVSIVSKDIVKELDAKTKGKLKNGISFFEIDICYGRWIRNNYIYPYLEKHKLGGKKYKTWMIYL